MSVTVHKVLIRTITRKIIHLHHAAYVVKKKGLRTLLKKPEQLEPLGRIGRIV
jgi:hypothetical protein